MTTETKTPRKHAVTATDKQRAQLDKLLKDPSKPVFIPPPPKEKTIRPPKEMMKNVQGSSAGAGSGEFHVYKANRRREYERIKMMEEQAQKEQEISEFEHKKREREEEAEAKTSKNRSKRQRKKERTAAAKSTSLSRPNANAGEPTSGEPAKKRRLVNGRELIFRRPGEEGSDSGEETESALSQSGTPTVDLGISSTVGGARGSKVVIHDD